MPPLLGESTCPHLSNEPRSVGGSISAFRDAVGVYMSVGAMRDDQDAETEGVRATDAEDLVPARPSIPRRILLKPLRRIPRIGRPPRPGESKSFSTGVPHAVVGATLSPDTPDSERRLKHRTRVYRVPSAVRPSSRPHSRARSTSPGHSGPSMPST
jgi:hypothetical protein